VSEQPLLDVPVELPHFVKRRPRPQPGSIPDVLRMFEREVRFYREVAPEVGVRVPDCYRSEDNEEGFCLVLENLSHWSEGGDPVRVASTLGKLHRRWAAGAAEQRWPWLRQGAAAAEAVGTLYDDRWPSLAARRDLPAAVVRFGSALVGRVTALERQGLTSPGATLVHGDASLRNTRTAPDGVIALVDWEDVRIAPGEEDLAWLLVSSVEPDGWADVIAAYAPVPTRFSAALRAAAVQGLFSLGDHDDGSEPATEWVRRVVAAVAVVD
jgi:hypothetical protein